MSYRIEVDSRAVRELRKLPGDAIQRIREAVGGMKEDPRPPGAKKLTGRGGYRIRVGRYRILYEIDDSKGLVRIYRIGHRRDIYR